jgi:hypothetical protein
MKSHFIKILIILLVLAVLPAMAQLPFLHEPSPAPLDHSELKDIASSPDGKLVAVGFQRALMVGGSPSFPLVMFKEHIDDEWVILRTPDFGFTWHHLVSVKFIPDNSGDFVAVGRYLPDPLSGRPNGLLLRYYNSTDTWDLVDITAPGAQFHFTGDFVFDPQDHNRILITGTRGTSDGGGNCFEFYTMIVDYNLETNTYQVLPTTTKGALYSIVPLPNGNFLAVGSAAGNCDYLPWPVVLEVEQGVEINHPIPGPPSGALWYDFKSIAKTNEESAIIVGFSSSSPLGGSNAKTMAYACDLNTLTYQFHKPHDPDTVPNFTNQLFRVQQSPDGKAYATGRVHYTYNNLHYLRGLIQSFDGESWHLHELPEHFANGHYSELWGLTFLPDHTVYAVGLYREPGTYDRQTLVLRSQMTTNVNEFSTDQKSRYLAIAGPNPFTGSTSVVVNAQPDELVSLNILNLNGKVVRHLLDSKKLPEPGMISWDGTSDGGHQLPSGIYLFHLVTSSGTDTQKVVKL